MLNVLLQNSHAIKRIDHVVQDIDVVLLVMFIQSQDLEIDVFQTRLLMVKTIQQKKYATFINSNVFFFNYFINTLVITILSKTCFML